MIQEVVKALDICTIFYTAKVIAPGEKSDYLDSDVRWTPEEVGNGRQSVFARPVIMPDHLGVCGSVP